MLDEIAKDAVAEILKPILSWISYYTGAIFLSVVTLGQLHLAPPKMRPGKRPGRKKGERKKFKFEHWFWVYRHGNKRYLHAEVTTLVGLLLWIGGLGFFLWTRFR